MAKIIKVEAYDMVYKTTKSRYINSNNIVETIDLSQPYGTPLTRIKMLDGTLIEIQKSAEEVMEIINAD